MKQFKFFSLFLILLSLFTSCQENKNSNLTLLSNEIPTDTALIYGPGVSLRKNKTV